MEAIWVCPYMSRLSCHRILGDLLSENVFASRIGLPDLDVGEGMTSWRKGLNLLGTAISYAMLHRHSSAFGHLSLVVCEISVYSCFFLEIRASLEAIEHGRRTCFAGANQVVLAWEIVLGPGRSLWVSSHQDFCRVLHKGISNVVE